MTSQPQPAPGEGRSPGQFIRPLRDYAAWALVGAPAVLLFVAILRLIPAGDGEQFVSRTQDSFYAFVNLPTIFMPLAAVLLALLVQPQHPQAKLITVVAAVEYAVAAFFGVIFGILVGLVRIAGFSVRSAFEELLVRGAWLVVFALAGFAVYKLWRGLFYVPKPQAQPGVYGSPQYGVPGTYPGQPGYGPPPGQQPSWNQPAYGQPAYGQPGAPGWGQPQPGQPGQSGQPQSGQPQPGQPMTGQQTSIYETGQHTPPPSSAPPANPFATPAGGFGSQPAATQPMPPGVTQPVSALPASGAPASGAPAWGTPASAAPASGAPAWSASSTSDAPASSASGAPTPGVPASAPPASAPPASAPPVSGAPASASSASGAPASSPFAAFAEPTQVVSQHQPSSGQDDRTEVVRDERPGFGPAEQDPPRH